MSVRRAIKIVGEYFLWMPRSADLVYGANQGVLVAGLECNVEINLVPAGGGPRLSQSAGMIFQACLTCTSSQCGATYVARLTVKTMVARVESTGHQLWHMIAGNLGVYCRLRRLYNERALSTGTRS